MIKKLQIFVLVIVPLVFLVVGFKFDRTKYSTDPESAYLLNGLNIAMGKSVGHFDNPGTTVQIYSAVGLRVTHFLRFTGTDIQMDVLLHSEYYIEVLRYSLVVMNTLVLFALGFFALSFFGNLWLALLLQITPFLSVTLIEELYTKVAPEPILFATVALLTILLFKYYTSADGDKKKYVLLFALLSGFGLATKMTFLPFTIIPFIILEGWRRRFHYLLLIIPSFILFTLPAVKGYPQMAKWFIGLGTHTGTYGQGSTGFIDPVQYLNSLMQIAVNNTELLIELVIVSFVLLAIWLMRKKIARKTSDHGPIILLSLLIAQAASILMVAKHYHSNHYLFPALSLIGTVLVFMYLVVIKNLKEKGHIFLNIGMPVLVAVIVAASILHIPDLTLAYKGYLMSNDDTNETMLRLNRDYKGYIKTYYYPTSFNEYSSLRWGNVYSRQFHTERLKQLFPEGLFYNAWDKSFQLWETSFSPGEFVAKYGGKILLIGGPRTEEEIKLVEDAGLKLKKLYEGRLQVIYEVDTANSALFHGNTHSSPPIQSIKNDFESISADKQWIMNNGEQFCKTALLSGEKPRSGHYSFAMPVTESFAMDFELKNIKPGQVYELSIWRFGDNENASLVVTANNPEMFYAASKGFLEKDANGWKKINLSIKVPDDFADNRFKVYLWNHGAKPAWFDDLEVARYK